MTVSSDHVKNLEGDWGLIAYQKDIAPECKKKKQLSEIINLIASEAYSAPAYKKRQTEGESANKKVKRNIKMNCT